MAQEQRFGIPGVPFPIGVEYYRPPTPKPEVWDADFARIRAAGLNIVRSFPYWQWFEPSPGVYEMDDIDLLFDTAHKHGLYVWLDVPTATHGAGPDWLLREYPDMRVINYLNEPVVQDAHPAYAQGAQVHCFDHPAFRDLAGDFLRHAINRYKDRPNLLIWGIWDGPNLSSAWAAQGGGFPCYCTHTLAKYKAWLRAQFTLDELNVAFQPPLPPLGGRRAAALRPQRRGDALVPALSSREHRRLPAVDDGPGELHRPGAREARARRLAAAAEGRVLRSIGGQLGHVDVGQPSLDRGRSESHRRPGLRLRLVASRWGATDAGGTRRSTPACRAAASPGRSSRTRASRPCCSG